jgi:hypothetical protein
MNYVGEVQLILSTTCGREMNYVGFRVRPYLEHHLWDIDRAGGVVQLSSGWRWCTRCCCRHRCHVPSFLASPSFGPIEEMRASTPALSLLQDDPRWLLLLPVFVELGVPQEGIIIVFLCLVLMVLCMWSANSLFPALQDPIRTLRICDSEIYMMLIYIRILIG